MTKAEEQREQRNPYVLSQALFTSDWLLSQWPDQDQTRVRVRRAEAQRTVKTQTHHCIREPSPVPQSYRTPSRGMCLLEGVPQDRGLSVSQGGSILTHPLHKPDKPGLEKLKSELVKTKLESSFNWAVAAPCWNPCAVLPGFPVPLTLSAVFPHYFQPEPAPAHEEQETANIRPVFREDQAVPGAEVTGKANSPSSLCAQLWGLGPFDENLPFIKC